jgi:hypothetical protein
MCFRTVPSTGSGHRKCGNATDRGRRCTDATRGFSGRLWDLAFSNPAKRIGTLARMLEARVALISSGLTKPRTACAGKISKEAARLISCSHGAMKPAGSVGVVRSMAGERRQRLNSGQGERGRTSVFTDMAPRDYRPNPFVKIE